MIWHEQHICLKLYVDYEWLTKWRFEIASNKYFFTFLLILIFRFEREEICHSIHI